MSDMTQLTDDDLHARLQSIHDELQLMLPVRAKTDEPVRPLYDKADSLRWARERPLLEAERERIRSELRRRDQLPGSGQG